MRDNDMRAGVGLYSSWSSHRHPLNPKGPLGFGDIPSSDVFYRAIHAGPGNRELAVFEKYTVSTRPLAVKAPAGAEAGSTFEVLSAEGAGPHVGPPISPSEALERRRWVVLGANGRLRLIEIEKIASTHYVYGVNGKLERVEIEDESGSRAFNA